MGHVDLGGLWHESSFRLVETYDVTLPRGWRIPLEVQPYGEVFEVLGGRCLVELAGERAVLEPGDVGLLLPGPDRVTQDVGDEPLHIRGFGFRLALFGTIELSGLLGLPLRLRDPWWDLRARIVETVARGRETGAPAALRARATAELAVADLTERHGSPRTPVGSPRAEIVAAIERMERDPAGAHDLDSLSSAVHLSAKHFARLFKNVVGVPPMTYLQALRLHRARAALATGAPSVADVAHDHGFADAAHFARSFRQAFDCTPTEFRARATAGDHSRTDLCSSWTRPGETSGDTMVPTTAVATPAGAGR